MEHIRSWAPTWDLETNKEISTNKVRDIRQYINSYYPSQDSQKSAHDQLKNSDIYKQGSVNGTFWNHQSRVTYASQILQITLGFIPHLQGYERQYYIQGILNIQFITIISWFGNTNKDFASVLITICILVWGIRLLSYLFIRTYMYGIDNKIVNVRNNVFLKGQLWLSTQLWVLLCSLPIISLHSSTSEFTLPSFRKGNSLSKYEEHPQGLISGWWSKNQQQIYEYSAMYRPDISKQYDKVYGITKSTQATHSIWKLSWRIYVGLGILWLIGFIIQVVSDYQRMCNNDKPPNNGLWKFSKHPNYIGELFIWTGITLACSTYFSGWNKLAYITPIALFIIQCKCEGIAFNKTIDHKRRLEDNS